MKLWFLTLMFATSWFSSSAQERACECIGNVMNCIAKNKTTFGPNDRCPGKIQRLSLLQNRIERLSSNAFSGLRDLEWLVLDKNKLSTLPKEIFRGLNNLKTLSIEENGLSSLPEDIFKGVEKLETLSLENNKLTTLPRRLFNRLQNIQRIGLANNPLRNIPIDLLSALTKIKLLELSQIGISAIPRNFFKDLKNLRELHLSNNKIKTLSSRDLAGIKSLEKLYLDYNQFTTLPKYDSGWPKIEEAVFLHNKIEDVSEPVLRSWLESDGRVEWLLLATPTSPPLRNPASLQWVLAADGVSTTVSGDCRCGGLRKGGTRVTLCLAVACGGPGQPADWVAAVRATAGGSSQRGRASGNKAPTAARRFQRR